MGTTIGFTRDSLKLLVYKSELIIMPIVSFFSFSKTKLCQQKDGRVMFSQLVSFINIIISTICSAGVLSRILTVSEVGNEARIISCLVPHFLGVVFSLMFIFYDKICCCCCDCFLGAEERIVYDPSHPENKLIWENGKIIE